MWRACMGVTAAVVSTVYVYKYYHDSNEKLVIEEMRKLETLENENGQENDSTNRIAEMESAHDWEFLLKTVDEVHNLLAVPEQAELIQR